MIEENVRRILDELPEGVQLVAAAKTRSPRDIRRAVDAGIRIVGENYVQEAQAARKAIGDCVRWHCIGHLQRNKAKLAVQLFDMIETLDSPRLAKKLQKECRKADKTMPVLIEVNSGRERQKAGVVPEKVMPLVELVSELEKLRLQGLMTMGPRVGDPEEARPYFQRTKRLFDELKEAALPSVEMKYLSMGMSNTYKVAMEEGANMVRIGTRLFGERDDDE